MDEFFALGEITITIAGFAALFSILRSHKKSWDDADKLNLIRFYMMIEFACLISIFCFLPVILLGYFNTEIAFRLSFGLYFLVVFPYEMYGIKRNIRYSGKIAIDGVRTVVLLVIWNLILLYALLGTLGLLGENYKTNYLLLLFLMFSSAIYLFMRLIYFSIRKV
jgi:hypothetical protein